MSRPIRVLIVEDNESDALLLLRELRRGGYEPESDRVDTMEQLRAALAARTWDIVISDHSMPQFSSTAALNLLHGLKLDLPFIIVSGSIDEGAAVAAMKAGASDYLFKGNLTRLAPAVERELREAAGRREQRLAREELRRSEERLFQAQKMEVVGRLAGGVAHDFNNLLTVIQGFSELILHRGNPDPETRGRVQEIHSATVSAAALTHRLLGFSRQQVVQPRVLEPNTVVLDMHKLMRRLIGEDIRLTTVPQVKLGRIQIDPVQLEQVLVNLVVNARDAMPAGGQLTIETSNVELEPSYTRNRPGLRPGQYVQLAVSDTGTGMDPATQARIFEPFFTTKEIGKGTGLGLATVQGIVQQYHGDIVVYSALGQGTTFKIFFPRVEAELTEVKSTDESVEMPAGSEMVLVIEDDPAVRLLVSTTLTSLGYALLEAQDGRDAVRVSREHAGPIDLVLSDMVMPYMNGPEAVAILLTERPAARVLFMSGYADNAVVHQGLLDPRTAFISKPFGPRALANKVRDVLDGDRRVAA